MTELDCLLSVASEIGGRLEAGQLPAQDAYGRYVFTDADLTFPVLQAPIPEDGEPK